MCFSRVFFLIHINWRKPKISWRFLLTRYKLWWSTEVSCTAECYQQFHREGLKCICLIHISEHVRLSHSRSLCELQVHRIYKCRQTDTKEKTHIYNDFPVKDMPNCYFQTHFTWQQCLCTVSFWSSSPKARLQIRWLIAKSQVKINNVSLTRK